MTDILTVTLNPALDVSACTAQVRATSKLRCDRVQRHPGGGGINVARVLQRLGAACNALCLVGGPAGQMLLMLLQEEGVRCLPVNIEGHTRESFTVLDDSDAREYRFVLPGPQIQREDVDAFLALVAAQPRPRFVVASGSLPPGAPVDFYARLADVTDKWNAKLFVDGSGPPLAAALERGVFMIKPSLREIRELTQLPLSNLHDVGNAARHWVDRRCAEVVAVSLGERGALMVHRDGTWYAPPLSVKVVSAVGAGDSFVAGMAWSLSQGEALERSFAYGVAAGTAALTNTGTGLSAAADVHRLVRDVTLLEELPEMAL
jgi:6-phosphofructokinase 2